MEFLIGIITGVAGMTVLVATGVAIWATSLLTAHKRYSKEELSKIIKNAQTVGSCNYRFTVIEDIAKQQQEILTQIEGPLKGTSHAKYKQEMISQVNAMEAEKVEIFRTILADGVDPVLLTVDPDGIQDQAKMSEIVRRFDLDHPNLSLKPQKTDSNKSCKNESNVIQLFKSKENQDVKSSDPEVDKPR